MAQLPGLAQLQLQVGRVGIEPTMTELWVDVIMVLRVPLRAQYLTIKRELSLDTDINA